MFGVISERLNDPLFKVYITRATNLIDHCGNFCLIPINYEFFVPCNDFLHIYFGSRLTYLA